MARRKSPSVPEGLPGTKKVRQWWTDTVTTTPSLWYDTTMGIDWGEGVNAWAIVGHRGVVLEEGLITETPGGVNRLLEVLRAFSHPETGELSPVAIETPRRLLVAALLAEGVEIVPLNPKAVKEARGQTSPRNASKTDKKDARLLANLLRENPSKYHVLHQSTHTARAITLLNRSRDQAVKEVGRAAGRVRSALAEYHPNAIAAFTEKQMKTNLEPYWVLQDALTPSAARRLRQDGIAARMMKKGGRGHTKGLKQATARVHEAFKRPSLAYPAEFEAAFAEVVRSNLEVLRVAIAHRDETDKRLREVVRTHPLWDLLSPAKGAGEAVVGGIIAEMGDDPHRFEEFKNLAAFAGAAPFVVKSGKQAGTYRRNVKGNRLQKSMWHWAESAAKDHPGARHYYWTHRSQGRKHPHTIRKMQIKLLRGVHACMVNGTVWDDERMWSTTLSAEEINQFVLDTRAELKARKQADKEIAAALLAAQQASA